MPLYDTRCPSCGSVQEIFRSYEQRDADLPVCACGGQMARCLLPPQVMRDIAEYQSPLDGTMITTRSQHRDHMKRHGVIELGNEKPQFRKGVTIPRESIRAEMRNQLNRMKSEGTWRER